MGLPRFQVLTGVIDGVNDTFYTLEPYDPGTIAIYLNGQLLFSTLGNPWTESDPSIGEVTMAADNIPQVGDTIAAFFFEGVSGATILVESPVQPLEGTINTLVNLGSTSEFAIPDELEATISAATPLGELAASTELEGSIAAVESLTGTLEVCS